MKLCKTEILQNFIFTVSNFYSGANLQLRKGNVTRKKLEISRPAFSQNSNNDKLITFLFLDISIRQWLWLWSMRLPSSNDPSLNPAED